MRRFFETASLHRYFKPFLGAAGSAKTLLRELELVGRRVTGRRDLAMPQLPEFDRQAVPARHALGTSAPNLTGHQFLLVEYPEQRTVLADGSAVGFTNQTLPLPSNTYVITLGGDSTR